MRAKVKADQVSQYTDTHCSEMTGMQAELQRPICGGGGGDRGEIIPMPSAAFPILRGYACVRVCMLDCSSHGPEDFTSSFSFPPCHDKAISCYEHWLNLTVSLYT